MMSPVPAHCRAPGSLLWVSGDMKKRRRDVRHPNLVTGQGAGPDQEPLGRGEGKGGHTGGLEEKGQPSAHCRYRVAAVRGNTYVAVTPEAGRRRAGGSVGGSGEVVWDREGAVEWMVIFSTP